METDDPVTFLDVYNEFNEKVAERFKITKFKSRVSRFFLKCSLTNEKFNFLKNVSELICIL